MIRERVLQGHIGLMRVWIPVIFRRNREVDGGSKERVRQTGRVQRGQRIGKYGTGLRVRQETALELNRLLKYAVFQEESAHQTAVISGVEDSVARPQHTPQAI